MLTHNKAQCLCWNSGLSRFGSRLCSNSRFVHGDRCSLYRG